MVYSSKLLHNLAQIENEGLPREPHNLKTDDNYSKLTKMALCPNELGKLVTQHTNEAGTQQKALLSVFL